MSKHEEGPDLDALREAVEAARASIDELTRAVKAAEETEAYQELARLAQRPPVPTEAGDFYLADGERAMVRPSSLGALAEQLLPNGQVVSHRVDSLTWATHPTTGEFVPVPEPGEWLEALGERDDARAERDALRAQVERVRGLAVQLVGDMASDHDPSVQEYARALSDVIDALEPPPQAAPPVGCGDVRPCCARGVRRRGPRRDQAAPAVRGLWEPNQLRGLPDGERRRGDAVDWPAMAQARKHPRASRRSPPRPTLPRLRAEGGRP